MFLDYHNILWYYHHVIVFCATPIQAFQSVSEPHTLLSLYFSQQHHYAAEQWAVDFFVFEGTFSPAARMTPAMPSAGASIQTLCLEDVAFARNVMHPRKNMVNCFRYIKRRAFEFAKQEMEDNDVKPSAEGYGTDVPDGLCYQWAEDYFKDMNAKEDRGQEEKFVPKPYYGGRSSTTKKAEKKKAEKPAAKAEEKPADTPTEAAPLDEQISFDSLGVSA